MFRSLFVFKLILGKCELDKPSNCLNTNPIYEKEMTNILHQLTKSSHGVPKLAVGILLVLFGVGFFGMGFDQGQLFSLIEGPNAYGDMYLHEFSHDMRHASGFPCH
jgi:hypothetical protein